MPGPLSFLVLRNCREEKPSLHPLGSGEAANHSDQRQLTEEMLFIRAHSTCPVADTCVMGLSEAATACISELSREQGRQSAVGASLRDISWGLAAALSGFYSDEGSSERCFCSG